MNLNVIGGSTIKVSFSFYKYYYWIRGNTMNKKNMDTENTRGNHQPYWYESFVGLLYVIDLFNESSDIKSVEFQSIETQKLDDVVVTYKDNKIECIQVKSTEKEETIGFETLVNKYLKDWSIEWKNLKDKKQKIIVTLFSNRRISGEWLGNKASGEYIRPKLDEFWKYINSQIKQAKKVDDIKMPSDKKWDMAWSKWLEKIQHLNDGKSDLRLEFIKSFNMKLEQEDYYDLQEKIHKTISEKYNIDPILAQEFLNDLKSALSDWTTSDGKRKFGNIVTNEVILKAVNKKERYLANNHNIPPNNNFLISRESFINNIVDEINKTDKKVMFLKGRPGTGKTTTISYMAYKSSIDFRFYSYKPFNLDSNDPGHELSKSRDLWSDLYCQIKDYILTNIIDTNDFRLIPYVEWIKQESLKYEVLRLLRQLALKQSQRVIVAIDGIDHAARNEDIDSFLKSFISPDIIPDNVFFIVTGQPDYKEYPVWLLDERFAIQKTMTNISREDIRQLYYSSHINKEIFDENTFIDIVESKACGNTLSVIYAVKEAEHCHDMEQFNKRLCERNLESEVENYYSSIWKYCLDSIHEKIRTAIDIQLSIVFSVSSEGITIDLLKEVFDIYNLNEYQWNETLNRLRPLVSNVGDLYYIEINDVKVYLSRRVNRFYDKEKVNEALQKLAKYYLMSKKELYGKHYTAFKILKKIDNERMFISFFDVEFALEAIVINQSKFDLREQVNYVIKKAYNFRDWEVLFSVFHVLRIYEQSKKTVEWYGGKYIDNSCKNEYLNTEVCKHLNLIDYSVINRIFRDAENLFWNGELNRAQRLLSKYFGNKSFKEITILFTNEGINDENFSLRFRERINNFGRICRYCEYIIGIGEQFSELSSNEKLFIEFFISGWLEASKDFENIREEFTFKIPICIKEEFLIYLYELGEFDHWESILDLTKNIIEKELLTSYMPIRLQLVAWLIQKGKIDIFHKVFSSKLRAIDILNRIKGISINETNNRKIKLLAFCNLAFIYGYKNLKLKIDDDLCKFYYEHLDREESRLLICLLNLNYLYGNLYSKLGSVDNNSLITDFEESLLSLLSRDVIHTSWINTFPFVKDAIFKLIDFSQQCGPDFEKIVFDQFVRKFNILFDDNRWSLLFSRILCIFLFDRGENSKVKEYIENISNSSSYIWRINKHERDSIISELLYCAKKIDIEVEYIQYLNEWSKWFSISYIDDREYILYDLYNILSILLQNAPEKWKDYFLTISNLSKIICEIGSDDTKLQFDVEFAIAALKCSKNNFWDFTDNMNYKKSDFIYILNKSVSSYIDKYFTDADMDEVFPIDGLILIWEYIYNNSTKDYYSQRELNQLKESIVNYLVRFNFYDTEINRFKEINTVTDRLAQLSKVNNTEKIEKSYKEIIAYIEEQHEKKSPNWIGCIDLIDYDEKYRPKTMKEDINKIICFIRKKFNSYSIVNTEIEELYNRVFPFVNDGEKWDILYYHLIDKLKSIESFDIWLNYIVGNLSKFFVIKSKDLKIEDLEKQIKKIIEMHERILTGNFRYNYFVKNKMELKDCECDCWEQFIEYMDKRWIRD